MMESAVSTNELRKQPESARSQLQHQVNIDYVRTQNKFVFDAAVKAAKEAEGEDSASLNAVFASVVIPQSELSGARPPAPETGCIEVGNEGFLDKVSDFTFASMLTQPKVVTCAYRVRKECNWVENGCLLNSTIRRGVRLSEWEQMQAQATTTFLADLKEKWVPNVRNIIKVGLRDVGKGWYNLEETNRDIYEFSKLSRLLKMVTFMMNDSLRYMVESTLEGYSSFLEEASAGDCTVVCPNDVQVSNTKRKALFCTDLNVTATGVVYSQQPDDFRKACLAVYDSAVASPTSIERIEHQVMPHLLRNQKNCFSPVQMQSVRREGGKDIMEPVVAVDCRQRVDAAVSKWLPRMTEYHATYDQYSEFISSTVEEHVDELRVRPSQPRPPPHSSAPPISIRRLLSSPLRASPRPQYFARPRQSGWRLLGVRFSQRRF